MRTTIDIDDDLLAAIRELARYEGSSAGRVVSRLRRRALSGDDRHETKGRGASVVWMNAGGPITIGVSPFPPYPLYRYNLNYYDC